MTCSIEVLTAAFVDAGWGYFTHLATDGLTVVHVYEGPEPQQYVSACEWEPNKWTVRTWTTREGERMPLQCALRDSYGRTDSIRDRAVLRPILQATGALSAISDLPGAITDLLTLVRDGSTEHRQEALDLTDSIRWALEGLE